MGVLAPVSAHAGHSAQPPPINISGNFTKFPHFPVKIGLIGGIGGSPKYLFHRIPNILVTQEPMQNFKTVTQTLLGETAHFGFWPPQIGFFRGLVGVPKYFFFIGIFIFLATVKKIRDYLDIRLFRLYSEIQRFLRNILEF